MAGLFGGAPSVPPKTPIPDEQDPAVIAAKRRQYEIAQGRSGRASTFLSDDYSKTKLGSE